MFSESWKIPYYDVKGLKQKLKAQLSTVTSGKLLTDILTTVIFADSTDTSSAISTVFTIVLPTVPRTLRHKKARKSLTSNYSITNYALYFNKKTLSLGVRINSMFGPIFKSKGEIVFFL